MLPLGVIGISHKTASLKQREQFAGVCERRFRPGPFTQGEHPSVLLSTCNRVEWYFRSPDQAVTHSYFLNVLREEGLEDLEPYLHCYFGQECFEHLARVTAGLDSAIVGETEIQGQVKTAYELATQCYQQLPKELHFAFQKSLKIGKDLRSSFLPQDGAPALEQAIYKLGHQHFDFHKAKVLFVGASEINKKVLGFLKGKHLSSITLCNRSLDSGRETAEKYGIDLLPWEEKEQWVNFDCIIVGTRSPDYVICRKSTPKVLEAKRLLIDLSVPRNVDPILNHRQQLTLLNLDQMNAIVNKKKAILDHAVMQADIFLRDSIRRLSERYREKEALRLVGA